VSVETRYFGTSLDPAAVSAAQLLRLVRGHWSVENSLHFEKDRWWDEDRHVCRRPGLAERFTTLLTAAVSVLRALNPGAPGEPLRAQADALNWDIERAVNLLVR
jgi:Transposase DDE domain